MQLVTQDHEGQAMQDGRTPRLLTSAYKIFMKVIVERVQVSLSRVINARPEQSLRLHRPRVPLVRPHRIRLPTGFVALMEILHAGTTAAFLVNGELSDPI